jgi:ribulose kinase
MDGRVSGSFVGLTLNTKPANSTARSWKPPPSVLRWIVQLLRDAGVPVERFVASGGLPAKSPLLMQIYADVLGEEIRLAESDNSVALGAAILGSLAALKDASVDPRTTITSMARQRPYPGLPPQPRHQNPVRQTLRPLSHRRRLRRPIGADDAGAAVVLVIPRRAFAGRTSVPLFDGPPGISVGSGEFHIA